MSVQLIADSSAQVAQYFFNLLRTVRIARLNAQIASSGQASLMSLPDDLLWLILEHTRRSGLEESPGGRGLQDHVHLSMCSKRLRAIASPSLFRRVCLGSSWSPERMIESLRLLQRTEKAVQAVADLDIDLWPDPDQPVCPEILSQLGSVLADCMSHMSRLKSISISATLCCSDGLREAFEAAGLELPRVNTLITGSHLGWLARFCPNLEKMSSNDWLLGPTCGIASTASFIQSAAKAQSLHSFTCNAAWDLDRIDQVCGAMPQLHCIGLLGRISIDLDELLGSLRRFRKLRLLLLPDVRMLKGLNTSDCEHVSSIESDISTSEKAAIATIFRRMPRLIEVRLGRRFQAWRTTGEHRTYHHFLDWEAAPEHGQSHAWSRCGRVDWTHDRYQQDETWSQHTLDNDEAEAILSAAEDSASILSRTDTLTFG